MQVNEMYKRALMLKLRFPLRGLMSVEELFSLSFSDIDSIYKALIEQKKASDQESLFNVETKEQEILDLKIEIVKDVALTFKQQKAEREQQRLAKDTKFKLLQLKSQKQDEALLSLSIEEIDARLAALGDTKNEDFAATAESP